MLKPAVWWLAAMYTHVVVVSLYAFALVARRRIFPLSRASLPALLAILLGGLLYGLAWTYESVATASAYPCAARFARSLFGILLILPLVLSMLRVLLKCRLQHQQVGLGSRTASSGAPSPRGRPTLAVAPAAAFCTRTSPRGDGASSAAAAADGTRVPSAAAHFAFVSEHLHSASKPPSPRSDIISAWGGSGERKQTKLVRALDQHMPLAILLGCLPTAVAILLSSPIEMWGQLGCDRTTASSTVVIVQYVLLAAAGLYLNLKLRLFPDGTFLRQQLSHATALGASVGTAAALLLLLQPAQRQLSNALLLMALHLALLCMVGWPIMKSFTYARVAGRANSALLLRMLTSPSAQKQLAAFLAHEFSLENLQFWQGVEIYRRACHDGPRAPHTARHVAKVLFLRFLADDAPFPINISHSTRLAVHRCMLEDDYHDALLDAAQDTVFQLMLRDSFRRFTLTDAFTAAVEAVLVDDALEGPLTRLTHQLKSLASRDSDGSDRSRDSPSRLRSAPTLQQLLRDEEAEPPLVEYADEESVSFTSRKVHGSIRSATAASGSAVAGGAAAAAAAAAGGAAAAAATAAVTGVRAGGDAPAASITLPPLPKPRPRSVVAGGRHASCSPAPSGRASRSAAARARRRPLPPLPGLASTPLPPLSVGGDSPRHALSVGGDSPRHALSISGDSPRHALSIGGDSPRHALSPLSTPPPSRPPSGPPIITSTLRSLTPGPPTRPVVVPLGTTDAAASAEAGLSGLVSDASIVSPLIHFNRPFMASVRTSATVSLESLLTESA